MGQKEALIEEINRVRTENGKLTQLLSMIDSYNQLNSKFIQFTSEKRNADSNANSCASTSDNVDDNIKHRDQPEAGNIKVSQIRVRAEVSDADAGLVRVFLCPKFGHILKLVILMRE